MKVDAFMFGYQIGRQSSVIWKSEAEVRKPIAYLYNGVRLPALPESDKETYKYAVITIYISTGVLFKSTASLYVFKSYTYGRTSDGDYAIHGADTLFWACDIDKTTMTATGEWVQNHPDTSEVWIGVSNQNTKWANFNLRNEDGSIALAASEPIPVYE